MSGDKLPNLRIGHGFDIHPFQSGRPLLLGGVEIPSEFGLAGHSDADVLLHALTDAVLGALAWGDIGQWFPNTDEKYLNIERSKLFAAVWQKARGEGWELINCDSVLLAEKPKVSPFQARIRESIAALFGCSADRVGLKATTMEQLGAIGRGEGMAASCTVLLVRAT